MDEKQKLLKLRAEIEDAMQNIENAINHIRDYKELFDTKIRKALKRLCPTFSVRMDRGTAYGWISVWGSGFCSEFTVNRENRNLRLLGISNQKAESIRLMKEHHNIFKW